MNELVNIGGRWYWVLEEDGLQELTSYELQELLNGELTVK